MKKVNIGLIGAIILIISSQISLNVIKNELFIYTFYVLTLFFALIYLIKDKKNLKKNIVYILIITILTVIINLIA
jgi:asparagine N-glycosylation enzyme membrane subunit Stt3